MPSYRPALLGALILLLVAAGGDAAFGGGPLVAIELETRENTLDGCAACGCRVKGVLEPGVERGWWITFGLVTAGTEKGWTSAGASSRCGAGSFDQVAADFEQTIGTPFLVLDLATSATLVAEEGANLETRLTLRKLSGFGPNGRAVYTTTTQRRGLGPGGEGELTLPLLMPDDRERESFGVHELLLLLRATVVGGGPSASYAAISVVADVPGAEVLLDGGFVGRIVEGEPTVIRTVPTGAREVAVRDFSGREMRRQVTVEEGKATGVALEVLGLAATETSEDLIALGSNPQGHEEYWRVKDGALVVRIPAGEFLRGSPESEGEPHERPRRSIFVSDFLIDKTEVTWRQYLEFVEATGAKPPQEPIWGRPPTFPASFILWEDARAYCEWVGGRLPTEAEWEKAARGTDGRTYPWGPDWDPERCNSISGGPHRPESVGSFPDCVSPFGVLDLPGSMWEWCADWYGEDYYAESPSRDPQGPETGTMRIVRGGAWMGQPQWLRPAYRFKAVPTSPHADRGFRCAQEVPQ